LRLLSAIPALAFISQKIRILRSINVCHEKNSCPKNGDFLIEGKHLFEVGGRGKTFDQIADLPDSYLAIDDTEVGHGNRIPLWQFGFLY